MKITCLPKEGRRFVLTIYIDEAPWIDVHTKIFGHNISLPVCETLEDLHAKFIALEYAKTKKYALDRLALRSYPSAQLKKLLKKNLVSQETIQKILQEVTRLGYVNDEEWIERFVKGQARRHIGPQMIVYKLMNKGISHKQANDCVEKFANPSSALSSIRHLLQTKYKNRPLSDYKEKQKVFAALARKGFDTESIHKALEC